ncbi:unnamed protein product [Caenorhabditis nigoni]
MSKRPSMSSESEPGGNEPKMKREDEDEFVLKMLAALSNEKIQEILEKVVGRVLESYDKKFENIDHELVAHKDKIQMLENQILELNSKLEDIKKNISKMDVKGGEESSSPGGGVESAEEKERKRSIIVTGIPEYGRSEREAWYWDQSCMSKILNFLDIGGPPVSMYRLRKRVGRNRMMKVVFATSFDQKTVLARAPKLKNFPSGPVKVFIRPSLTKEQRVEYSKAQRDKFLSRSRVNSFPPPTNSNVSPPQVVDDPMDGMGNRDGDRSAQQI